MAIRVRLFREDASTVPHLFMSGPKLCESVDEFISRLGISDDAFIDFNQGEFCIRTPKQQTIADNNATILELLRAIRDDSPVGQPLEGQLIRVITPTEDYTGVISDVYRSDDPASISIVDDGDQIHRLSTRDLATRNIMVRLAAEDRHKPDIF